VTTETARQIDERTALKEWAAVCAALAAGRQTALFRKGGIDEGRGGFQVEHRGFWLFPTYEHQTPEKLSPDAAEFLQASEEARPTAGTIEVQLWAEVIDVVRLESANSLPRLSGQQIYTPQVLEERFAYRNPGLFVIAVRVYQAPETVKLVDSPHFAGCHSWVELPDRIPADNLQPVISEAEFAERYQALKAALAPSAIT